MFEDYTTADLEAELKRRKQTPQKPKPKTLSEQSFDLAMTKLYNACSHYIDALADGHPDPDDEEHYIFESGLELVYGEGIWNWVTEIMK